MNSTNLNSKTNINKSNEMMHYVRIYFVYIMFTFILGVVFIILYYKNPDGFSKYLGTSVFLTLLFAVFIFLIFHYYDVIKKFGKEHSIKMGGLDINIISNAYVLIGIVIIVSISNAIFKNLGAGDSNNVPVFINYAVIIVALLISIWTFYTTGTTSIPGLDNISDESKKALNSKRKYILLLALYLILSYGLFLFNPNNIITNYGGSTILLIMFFGLILLSMIVFYNYLFDNPLSKESKTMVALIQKMAIIISSISVSGLFLYFILKSLGVFSQGQISNQSIGSYVLNFIMLVILLGIVWKVIHSGNFLQNNSYFNLILNVLFYIPCLLVDFTDYILKQYHLTKKTELVLLLLEVIILIFYLVVYPKMKSSYYKQGGKLVINNPVSLETENNVATYESLNNSNTYNYQYAMSFWFYVNSTPPSYNSSFNKFTNILNYGNIPCVKYNAVNNTLLITVKVPKEKTVSVVDLTHTLEDQLDPSNDNTSIQNQINTTINKVKNITIQNEYDVDDERIIYKNENVLLQKWNNIIINFNGGTLDIFYNGELVKTAIEVVSYINYDLLVVGSEKGVSGDVCNLIYYDKTLDYYTIKNLYNIMKDKTPPCDTTNKNRIIQTSI